MEQSFFENLILTLREDDKKWLCAYIFFISMHFSHFGFPTLVLLVDIFAKWSSLEFSFVAIFYNVFYIFFYRVAVATVLERMSLVQVFFFLLIKLSAVVNECAVIYILHALTVLVVSACFFLKNVEDKKWNFSLYMLDQLFMK